MAILMLLAACRSLQLAWTSLFTPGENQPKSMNALLQSALVIVQVGVAIGFPGFGC
jgi:hypothetical protein